MFCSLGPGLLQIASKGIAGCPVSRRVSVHPSLTTPSVPRKDPVFPSVGSPHPTPLSPPLVADLLTVALLWPLLAAASRCTCHSRDLLLAVVASLRALSPLLSRSLFLFLSLCLSVSLTLSLCFFLSFSLSLCFSYSLSLFLSLSLSLSVSLSLSLSVSLSASLSLPLSLCLITTLAAQPKVSWSF